MKNQTIARRYAKALLLIGKEDGQAEAYRKELVSLSELLEKEKELERVISNPLYDISSRRKLLEIIIGKLDISKVMISFVMLLFDKGRIGFIRNISDYYEKLADELKGVARAELISASDLSMEAVESGP